MANQGDVLRQIPKPIGFLDKTAFADATDVSLVPKNPITCLYDTGKFFWQTLTAPDGTWNFWDFPQDGTYYAYTVGQGEDWKIVVTNPTCVVTRIHYPTRAGSQAFIG